MQVNIGVIRKQNVPAAQPPRSVATAEDFAGRIAGRYLPREFTASRADLALAYEPPAQVNYFQDARAEIATSVNLHQHYSFAAMPRDIAPAAPVRQDFGESQAAALFARLFSRHKRVAVFEENGSPAVQRALDRAPGRISNLAAMGVEAVDRVLPRKAAPEEPAVQGKEMSAIEPNSSDAGWGLPPIALATPRPLMLPDPEVRRVADQVMREIDHRIVARRERWGMR
jgi:hypothetical protein